MEPSVLYWIVWAISALVAVRCLVALAISLRNRLHQKLKEHLQQEQVERKKNEHIRNLRMKIRQRKAKQDESGSTQSSKEKNSAA